MNRLLRIVIVAVMALGIGAAASAQSKKLQESEAKFSGIVSISADAIISIDDQQRMTIFNDGAERIFGYSRTCRVLVSIAWQIINQTNYHLPGDRQTLMLVNDYFLKTVRQRIGENKKAEEAPLLKIIDESLRLVLLQAPLPQSPPGSGTGL